MLATRNGMMVGQSLGLQVRHFDAYKGMSHNKNHCPRKHTQRVKWNGQSDDVRESATGASRPPMSPIKSERTMWRLTAEPPHWLLPSVLERGVDGRV